MSEDAVEMALDGHDKGAVETAHTGESGRYAPPEARQFDFWIGDWDALWGEGKRGSNTVRCIYDGRVILENFNAAPGGSLRGGSVSVYSEEKGRWLQTWVDNAGSYLDFEGEFAEGKMVLVRRAKEGGRDILQRMVWLNIEQDGFDWRWEKSEDGGDGWQVLWAIRYTRRGA